MTKREWDWELTGLMEQELVALSARCWKRGGFSVPDFEIYKKKIKDYHDRRFKVTHHYQIIEAYQDAYEMWKQILGLPTPEQLDARCGNVQKRLDVS